MSIIRFPAIGEQKKDNFIAELYTQHKNFMYNIANAVLRDPGEAENAVHDAFVRVIKNIEKFDLRDCHKTKNLLGTIVKGCAVDAYRRRKNMVVTEELPAEKDGDFENPAEDQLIEREQYEDLKGRLASLGDTYVDIVLLKHSGYSNAEVAALLGVTEDVVRQRLHRARSKLKKQLGTEGERNGAQKSQ
jgi:RNA polymerase sigma-70 factor (ECF subfamily)